MPIYEYECQGCGEVFAVRQKVSDPAPSAHNCGSSEVRRILSATSFVLKGTGWYKTDYADKKSTATGDGERKPDGGERADDGSKAKEGAKADDKGPAKGEPAGTAKPGAGGSDKAAKEPAGAGKASAKPSAAS